VDRGRKRDEELPKNWRPLPDDYSHCRNKGSLTGIADMASHSIQIYIDADACPVKEEVYKVAYRYEIPVCVVSNSLIRIPKDPLISRVVVSAGPDVADDYIAERATPTTVIITADILLAERGIIAGSKVIGPTGKLFTEESIGSAVATRALMEGLRSTGAVTGGPAPFAKSDRSRFLSALDQTLVHLIRDTR
jgi:hypothetical protein